MYGAPSSLIPFVGDGHGALFMYSGRGAGNVRWVTTGDVDGNGIDDALVAMTTQGSVTVHYGQPSPGFGGSQTLALPSTDRPTAAVMIFTHDGRPDIVVADCGSTCASGGGSGDLELLRQSGGTAPALSFDAAVALATKAPAPLAVASADLNGDGALDIAAMTTAGARFMAAEGTSSGTFTGDVDTGVSGGGDALALGDMDGDGKTDAVIQLSNGATTSFGVLRNSSTTGGAISFASAQVQRRCG